MTEKAIKTHMSHAALLLLAITIVGCSAVTYEEPKSGPVARVRFVSDTKTQSIIRSYGSKECDDEHEMMKLGSGFFFSDKPTRLGMPLWNHHENDAKELIVRASVPQVYAFESHKVHDRYRTKCAVLFEQTFDQNKDYELNYSWNSSKCLLNIYEIKTDNLGESKKVFLRKVNNKVPSSFSNNCLVKFKEHSWY